MFKKKPWAALERDRHEKDRTESEEAKRLARAVRWALAPRTPPICHTAGHTLYILLAFTARR